MAHLDPTLDVVFKLLLTREPVLLRDMLQGILARPIHGLTILDPDIQGERVDDRRVVFDIRARLHDGTGIDLEMQRDPSVALASRLVYYVARDYTDQLRRGGKYHQLAPSIGIAWLVEPLFPDLQRLHSIFELRERHLGARFGDQLSIHLLQLPHLSPSGIRGYTATVERWARFFRGPDDLRHQLASEDPIMSIAVRALETLSADPDVRERALRRQDQIRLYEVEVRETMAAARAQGLAEGKAEGRAQGKAEGRAQGKAEGRAQGKAEGRAEGKAEGKAEGRAQGKAELLLSLLELRVGPLPAATRARIESATTPELDAWARRMLTARTLDDIMS